MTLSNGTEPRASASQNTCALIIVPDGLDEKSWPVTMGMEPPEGIDCEPVGPAQVMEYPEG